VPPFSTWALGLRGGLRLHPPTGAPAYPYVPIAVVGCTVRRGIAGWARQAGAGGWGWQAGAGRLGLAGWGWQMLAGWGWQVAAGSLGLGLVGWGWLAGVGAHLRLRRTVFVLQIPGIRRQLTSPNPLTPPRGSRWGGNSRGHPTP